ncbi:hypothetical protein QCE62_31025 [Caballeronia sp. LZ033]|uniref:hypothetical protein n=1 Tax=Caballeronia sp. LZ033 TaxID=3038566 RepID=UPI0028569D43|nr:hypothetical protein [Caballeronia sp. LZ033]MDR5818054.1 hypothetical protein [Caballeronia sp. LZ033]
MNALPQPKTHQLVDRINALRAASPRFIDPAEITPLSREWRAIGHDIRQLLQADARAAWELTGSWRALAGDVEGAEGAFRNAVALGLSDVGRENWMITRLGLGMFSAAQALYRELCGARTRNLAVIAPYGFLAGAVGCTAELIREARMRGGEWDEEWAEQVSAAASILTDAGVTDDEIAQRLDCTGIVLRQHRLCPDVNPLVIDLEGICRCVSFRLSVPTSWDLTKKMNEALLREEGRLMFFNTAALGVYFDGACK